MRITSIERPPRKQRYEVCVEGVLVIPLSPVVLVAAGLRPGQEVTDEQLKTLEEAEVRHLAMASALRLLGYRQRSEKEMREALQRRRVRPDVLQETMDRLREMRLLDDGEFARTYVDARDRTSPRSRRMLRAELRAHGVDRAAAEDPVNAIDEADAAYRAAEKRARSLGNAPWPEFQRKLGEYLLRRGFGYEFARTTVGRLWEELGGATPAEE